MFGVGGCPGPGFLSPCGYQGSGGCCVWDQMLDLGWETALGDAGFGIESSPGDAGFGVGSSPGPGFLSPSGYQGSVWDAVFGVGGCPGRCCIWGGKQSRGMLYFEWEAALVQGSRVPVGIRAVEDAVFGMGSAGGCCT